MKFKNQLSQIYSDKRSIIGIGNFKPIGNFVKLR